LNARATRIIGRRGGAVYFPIEEYEDRWRRVYEELSDRGFDAALVWSRSGGTHERCGDVLYLTNYYSSRSGHVPDLMEFDWMGASFAAVIMAEGEPPELVPDSPEYPRELLATDRVTLPKTRNIIREAARAVRDRGIRGRVAFVGDGLLPHRYARILEDELPEVELIPADDLVENVRLFKSPRELDCYREAGEIVSAALDVQMATAVRGGTQAEAAAAGAAELMRRGGAFHMIPVGSGQRQALDYFVAEPITGYSPTIVMEPGDIVRTWIYGPIWQGYWCDPGRTAVVGGLPTPRQRDLIRAANDITQRMIDAIRPDTTVSEVTQLGDRLRSEAGTAEDATSAMFPIYGHGVGLFWEKPRMVSGADQQERFLEGHTLGIEVFLSWPDVGSVGVEQNIIVGRDENELLTTTDLEWW
jgi:Xaa-Pro dipeptidase